MFKIDPDTLYNREDLQEALAPLGVDVDLFIGRIKPRKVFRLAWFGADLIAALKTAPALDEHRAPAARQSKRSTAAGKRGGCDIGPLERLAGRGGGA